MDSIRYALWPLIKNLPTSGFFNRVALLAKGLPAAAPFCAQNVYGVLSTSARAGTAAGFIICATSPSDVAPRLTICYYDLIEVDEALSIPWLESAYQTLRALAKEYRMLTQEFPAIHVEQDSFGLAAFELCSDHAARQNSVATMINLEKIDRGRDVPIPTLDETAQAVRSTVNSGAQPVKLSRVALERQITNRGATTNHLLSQIVSYQAGAKEMPQELVAAFCTGIAIWREVR